MGVNEVTNVIGALGFPIAACVFLAWYLTSKFEKMVDTMVQTQKNFAKPSTRIRNYCQN